MNKHTIISYVVVTIISLSSSIFSKGLIFDSERIVITISDGSCIVKGEYHLKNNSLNPIKNWLMNYPFPAQNNLPFPDSIVVTDFKNNTTITSKKLGSGIVFKVSVEPMETKVYQVKYFQSAPNNRFEYILLTTQKWGQPLSKAQFIIKMPKSYILTYISLDYDKMEEHVEERWYYINRQNFMPSNNLIIEWEKDDKNFSKQ